jgi:hypothetical protein
MIHHRLFSGENQKQKVDVPPYDTPAYIVTDAHCLFGKIKVMQSFRGQTYAPHL